MARRILVAEDSPTQAELVRLLLEQAGYQVDLAANGREGLEKVHTDPPDLIISDVMMPEMDGYAFCQAVKSEERTRRIPFVLLTQRNTPQDILTGLTRGADNFIPKPFDDEYLLERVKRIFEHLEFRRKGQLDMDVTLRVGDRELVINADKQQIIELLFATFDDVCKLNQMLLDAERKLEDYTLHLEAKVQERTEALRRLNRNLRAISLCNQILVRAASEEELPREICRIIVEVGEHRAAWVGLVAEGEQRRVRPVAVVGCESERVDRHAMDLADPAWETCPVAMAIRTGMMQVVQNIPGNPPRCPWHEEAVRLGIGSSISLPLKRDGRPFGVLTIYSALLDAFDAEEVTLLVELANDLAYGIQAIRTRVAHERALAEIESLARFPNENPHPVMRVREDGVIVYANAPSEPLLRLWDTGVGARMPAEWIARIRHALETRAQESLDVSCDDRIYSVIMAPIPEEGYVNLYGRDITDRKRAEEAREKSERTVRAMFDSARDGILLAEAATRRFVNANPAMCRMLGYSREEIERLSVADIHPPDRLEYVSAEFEKQLRGETILACDIPVTRKDGSVFLADVNSSPLELDGRLHLLGIFRDITDRKRLEEERTRLEAQLRQQQKLEAIGTLASGVAHEINNPINGIMNYAQLIADTVEPGSPAAAHAAEIVAETERVATIVRNLLQFARQEKQSHSPARIADIVEQTLSLFQAVLRHDQITLTVDVPADLPSLKCRSQQIQQVLMNLLTNARDALNERYPGYHPDKTIRITVRPFERDGRAWLRLTVADQGNGIPPEIQDRIFDPFFTTKPRDKGTGLGLSISHGIAKDHHGVLHFETAPGTGTRFHLDLPVDNRWRVEEE